MCINLMQRSPEIAKEDIIAYKVLEINSDDLMFTPYLYMHIKFNKLYIDPKQEREECYKLTSGVYHLFSSIEDAILLKEYIEKKYYARGSKFVIVKAIIPKGTKYYVGKCELGCKLDDAFQHESYGAKSVIYKELDA